MGDSMTDEETEERRNLWSNIATQTDSIQQEFRRRVARVRAVAEVAGPAWERLKIDADRLNAMRASKWRKAEWVLFLGGAMLWRWGNDIPFAREVGAALMIWGLASFGSYVLAVLDVGRRTPHLEAQQTWMRFEWLAAGVSDQVFWDLRQRTCEQAALNDRSENTDTWRAQILDIEKQIARLWVDVEQAIAMGVGVYVLS